MTASTRQRRSILPAAVLGALVCLMTTGPVAGASPGDDRPNRLEQPMADLAVLPSPVADVTPRLLVLDVTDSPSVGRLEVLERRASWLAVASIDIDLGADLDARWLIGLDAGRYALVATTVRGADRSVIVGLDVVSGTDGVTLVESDRQTFDRAIDDTGAADTDGDAITELLVHFRPARSLPRACEASDLAVLDGRSFATITELSVPGPRLGAGVIGRWDAVAGDDLLVYAGIDCPIGDDPGETRLLALRLRDGVATREVALGLPRSQLGAVGPPLRLDLDGLAPDEALAQVGSSLSILDPVSGWLATDVGSGRALPFVAGPAVDGGWRIAWMEPDGDGSVRTERRWRDTDGEIVADGGSTLSASDIGPERWRFIREAARSAAARQVAPGAWTGDALDIGCPDLVIPAAILPCGEPGLRPGAAWLATRPVAVMDIEGRRRLLVAAGIGWDPSAGLPPAPTPLAAGPGGWWRHGPSTPFALSEVRAQDVTYFRDFPIPRASVDATTAADATIAMPGFTGTRLFVMAAALSEGQEVPEGGDPSAFTALAVAGGGGQAAHVVRVPVAAGLESGRDGSFVRLSLADVTLSDGSPAARWSMRVVAINDWGEVGQPAFGVVSRDIRGPTLSLEVPFVSPIWPFAARLRGAAEPGSTVQISGIEEPIELDRRGQFVIDTTLAPWPQDLRLSAVDASGNRTERAVSVIGGIDYRRLPWALLGALGLLLLVTVRGLGTGGPARAVVGAVTPGRWAPAGSDDGPQPEIEDLPPGAGLPRL